MTCALDILSGYYPVVEYPEYYLPSFLNDTQRWHVPDSGLLGYSSVGHSVTWMFVRKANLVVSNLAVNSADELSPLPV